MPCLFVTLSVCLSVCQHGNYWTVTDRSIITEFSGNYPVVEGEAKFKNGNGRADGDLTFKPNTHCRRRHDSTVELSRVGSVYLIRN